ncbi:MAG TPA: glycosyltransferase family 4 protein [Nannocystaceae bacterium]|nr:glycosyltransferase family 4 protein [Nannocystaceae bacterium]
MRILVFTHYFPPEGNAPASRIHELGKRWVRAGHAVTVVTGPPSVPDGLVYAGYANAFGREVVDGIEVVRVPTYLAANKGTLRRTANFVSYMAVAVARSLALARPDVIVATSPQFFCGWAGVLCKWLRRRPLVLEIRDLWPESIVAVGAMKEGALLRGLERLERWMYAAADHVVTVGEGYAERLAAKGVAARGLTIVTNGIDREIFQPRAPDPALLERHGLAGRFVCAYVGTVGMGCGLGVLVPAAEALRARGRRDVGFLVVGDGAVRAEVAAEVAARGLGEWVVFAGRQPKEAIPGYLASAGCCLVHLQRTELFTTVLPSKVFEAMAMARPVVMGVEGEAARLVERSGSGICVTPEDPAALVEAVLRLADDPALARRMGEAGYEHVVRHYDRDRLAAEYLDVLGRFAGR